MSESLSRLPPDTYLNPVCGLPCPDPFVLAWGGAFWAYCTGFAADGRAFGVLRSADLTRWEPVGGAMAPLPGGFPMYWAPEVSAYGGRLWLYYSVGDEATMEIRVAVADHPAGPFADCGRRLTGEPFAIDAHVFADDDGARYLFYATDFLDHSHIGTGTVCDRLIDPLTLAGDPQPVTRACYDWHVYDPQRAEKGGVRWHTIEGSFVLKRKGRYYQMFSGGNWQNVSYGVGYAVTETLPAAGEWRQACDGDQILPILRTLPGAVVGPGHNSAVLGPDLMQWFCVYHRWADDGSERLMALDRLEWIGERLAVLGPSTTPQPAPIRAGACGVGGWQLEGDWSAAPDLLRLPTNMHAAAWLSLTSPHAIFACWMSAPDTGDGAVTITLAQGDDTLASVEIRPGRQDMMIGWVDAGGQWQRVTRQGPGFGWERWHPLRVEIDGALATLSFAGSAGRWAGRLRGQPTGLRLAAQDQAVAFAGLRLVTGWQQLFETDGLTAADLGWRQAGGESGWSVRQGALHGAADGWSAIFRGPELESYELVINVRLAAAPSADSAYGCLPVVSGHGQPVTALLHQAGARWVLTCAGPHETARMDLPAGFDPHGYQQLRFHKRGGRLTVWLEALELGAITVPAGAAGIGLCAQRASIACEMIRHVAIVT